MEITLTLAEWEYADFLSKNMSCSCKKRSVFGNGLINTRQDKYKVERIGREAEIAFSRLTGLPIDSEYRPCGDTCDFVSSSGSIDIKCSFGAHKTQGLIRVYANEKALQLDKKIPLLSDYYVFSSVVDENRFHKIATIKFHGYLSSGAVGQCPIEKSLFPKSEHYNYVVPFDSLQSLNDLLEKLGENSA